MTFSEEQLKIKEIKPLGDNLYEVWFYNLRYSPYVFYGEELKIR